MKAPYLDRALLRAILHYNPDTGVFTWLDRADMRPQWNGRYAGKQAGFDTTTDGKHFYRSIRIFDWPFMAHRLAFLYMTGKWPNQIVDHADLDGLNNKWRNLRPANKIQNGANARLSRSNKSGFKGVSRDATGRFRATIQENGRQQWLGYYDTAEEAHAVYLSAAKEIHGEYARSR